MRRRLLCILLFASKKYVKPIQDFQPMMKTFVDGKQTWGKMYN